MNWEKHYKKQEEINMNLTKLNVDLLKEIGRLQDQIEKMKCCGNCKITWCKVSMDGYDMCNKWELEED
jgi:hypothetical protein